MTANQLIAYNLRRARRELGLTQEETAQLLWDYLGVKWSVASFSDAERSADNGRTREFSANEILAFAQVFGKPIAWFFKPPDELKDVSAGADARRPVKRSELLDAISGSTLWDRVVLKDQIKTLRDAADALQAVVEMSGRKEE